MARNNDKDRIVRSVTVKFPKRQSKQEQDLAKDPALTGQVEDLKITAEELKDAGLKASSDIIDELGRLKTLSGDQLNLIREEKSTLSTISTNTKNMVSQFKSFKKLLSNKLSDEVGDGAGKSNKSSRAKKILSADTATASIVKKITENNKTTNDQLDIQKDIRSVVSNYSDEFGESTSEKLKKDHDDMQKRNKERAADIKDRKDEKKFRNSSLMNQRYHGSLLLRSASILTLVGVAVGFITKTLLKYTAAAVFNTIKWTAMIFGVIAAIDILSINVKHMISSLNKSFTGFDQKFGEWSPILQSILDTIKDLNIMWSELSFSDFMRDLPMRLIKGLGEFMSSAFDNLAYALADIVSSIIGAIPGMGDTAKRMKADSLEHKLQYSSSPLTDDEISLIAEQRTKGSKGVYDEFKNSKWAQAEKIKGGRTRSAAAFVNSNRDYFEKTEGGVERTRAQQEEHAQYLIDMDGVPEEDRFDAEVKKIKYLSQAKQMSKRIDKRWHDKDQLQGLKSDYEKLQSDFNSESGLSDGAKKNIQDELSSIITRLDNLLGDASNKPKIESLPNNDPNRGDSQTSLNRMSEQMNRPANKQSTGSNTNNVVTSNTVVNNKSINTGNIITSKDVPGMYKSMEVNS